jgi:diguanylate cyclase (GGDEF)-like protein
MNKRMAGPLQVDRALRGRVLRYAVLGNILPIAIAVATDFDSHHTVFFIGAIAACAAPLVVTGLSRDHPIPFYLAAYGGLPALTAMQAYSGGAASGYAVLMMMAMIWFGLRATDRELLVGLGMLAACSYLPMLIFGPPAYPVDWGQASLLVLVGFSVAGSLRLVARETSRLTRRLREQAIEDELTGLLNRRGWWEAGGRELAQADRTKKPVALLVLDLDNLKEINDTMGHDEGDRVLIEIAERMRGALRAADVIARMGGDEFVALMPDTSLDQALIACQRMHEAIPDRGRFSAGVAIWDGQENLDELMRRSDVALYAAKATGGDKVEAAPESLGPAAKLP